MSDGGPNGSNVSNGGNTAVVVQCSHDGVEWTDFWRPPDIVANAALVTTRFTANRDPGGTGVSVSVCQLGTPTYALAANTSAGGHWGDQLRVIMEGLASTNHSSAQIVRIKGVRPKR